MPEIAEREPKVISGLNVLVGARLRARVVRRSALYAVGGRRKGNCSDRPPGRGNGALYPVLKHGPRSLTQMRVRRWQTSVRNESDDWMLRLHHRPTTSLRRRGLSGSICVGTRKMVNYA